MKSLGGRLEAFHDAFGETDLFSAEEMDEATRTGGGYRPPG